jgi:uncharacterized iron-regulated protein
MKNFFPLMFQVIIVEFSSLLKYLLFNLERIVFYIILHGKRREIHRRLGICIAIYRKNKSTTVLNLFSIKLLKSTAFDFFLVILKFLQHLSPVQV